jgi:hypothetical protein
MSERIETLRDWAENRTMAPGDRSDLKWAIQELDRLAARVQELEKRQMISTCTVHGEIGLGAACHHCLDDVVAENTRLREALEKIRNLGPYEMQEMADDALKEKP